MHAQTRRPVRRVHVANLRANFHSLNGFTYVRSTQALGEYPVRVTDRLEFWADQAPHRVFLAQRGPGGAWRALTYAEAWSRVRKLASGLLKHGLSPSTPLIILSGNSIEHGLLALAAMYVGVPYAPIAPAYSLAVKEFGSLAHVWQNLQPKMVFVEDGSLFVPALKAVMQDEVSVVYHGSRPDRIPSISLDELESSQSSLEAEEANRRIASNSIAKILFTSGSTGLPKGVITTHRMLCANQKMLQQVMPCLSDEPPVVCDWLPWNHTFGGSHNFGIVLHNGGTLYIDAGNPTRGRFQETVRNLQEVAPTAYFNVPRGYEMLLEHLRANSELRTNFFRRLHLLFFAAAGLNQRTWDQLQDLAFETCGEEILVVTGLGATETAPFALSTGIEGSASGRIGLPVPGVELKLAPTAERTEARVRGPSITPGFWRRPDLDALAYDEEGFYRMGDAVQLADPADPQKGFVFDGRLNEDFKLSSGTWVRVGSLRMLLLAHFDGLLQDAVLAGPDRDYVAALFFPALERCKSLCSDLPVNAQPGQILARTEVRDAFQELLDGFAQLHASNSTCIARAILLEEPPSIEARELTDKGSINQREVLKNRARLVDCLYEEPVSNGVLVVRQRNGTVP